jgi:hypothetical protein
MKRTHAKKTKNKKTRRKNEEEQGTRLRERGRFRLIAQAIQTVP